jgi:hypothetical protein
MSFLGFREKEVGSFNVPKKPDEEKGVIGEYYEGDLPVIVKFINEFPEDSMIRKYPTIIVVSWKYDGKKNNGMPLKEINARMILLEKAIGRISDSSMQFCHAYSRTGNSLKELVYYAASQDEFMRLLNETLVKHERYPIDISFYEDPQWSEFAKLIEDFKQ